MAKDDLDNEFDDDTEDLGAFGGGRRQREAAVGEVVAGARPVLRRLGRGGRG